MPRLDANSCDVCPLVFHSDTSSAHFPALNLMRGACARGLACERPPPQAGDTDNLTDDSEFRALALSMCAERIDELHVRLLGNQHGLARREVGVRDWFAARGIREHVDEEPAAAVQVQ
jgi:hypothetical protein